MYVDVAYQAIVRQNRRCFDSAAMKENRLPKIDCLIRQQESNYEDCLQMDCKLLVKNHLLVKSLAGEITCWCHCSSGEQACRRCSFSTKGNTARMIFAPTSFLVKRATDTSSTNEERNNRHVLTGDRSTRLSKRTKHNTVSLESFPKRHGKRDKSIVPIPKLRGTDQNLEVVRN